MAGHCDCMAGLGETCSHVAAMLWAIESGIRLRDSMTVTQKKAHWVILNGVKQVPCAPVKEIHFVRKRQIHKRVTPTPSRSCSPSPMYQSSTSSPTPGFTFPLEGSQSSSTSVHSSSSPSTSRLLQPPTDEEVKGFFSSLALTSSKPAILSIIEPFSSNYVPKSLDENLPMCLLHLMKPENLKKDYGELLTLAKQSIVTVTCTQAETVQSKTLSQSKCPLWHRMRSGRITASNFKSACHANEASPPKSLIMTICHPELKKFTSAATSWGSEHEKTARDMYECLSTSAHEEFNV